MSTGKVRQKRGTVRGGCNDSVVDSARTASEGQFTDRSLGLWVVDIFVVLFLSGIVHPVLNGLLTKKCRGEQSRLRSSYNSALGLLLVSLPGVVATRAWGSFDITSTVNCDYVVPLAFGSLILCGLAVWCLSRAVQDLKRSIERCKARLAELAANHKRRTAN